MSDSDEALMTRVAGGSEEAFHALVMRYESRARRYCYRMFREVQVAEDIAQEVFLKLYRNADKYKPSGKFVTYFYRVLANHCYDRLRFEGRRAAVRGTTMDGMTLDGFEVAGGPGGNGRFDSPEGALVKKEEREIVRTAVKALPDNLRRALVLREFEGLKYREIAEVMRVSLSEVKVLIHRGRKLLAKRLERVLLEEGRR
jgi:RNA polymerase sigma-70 factor (ECF subfamily)